METGKVSMLSDMTGNTLYSMTFYSSDDAEIDAKGLQVYLAEVDFTTLPDKYAKAENGVVVLYDVADKIVTNTSTATDFTAVKVYDGDYDFGSGANVINFDTSYTYSGGNLLVIIQSTSAGTKGAEKLFYGDSSYAKGTSREKYSEPSVTYARTFLAKCTFGYVDKNKYTIIWKDTDGSVLETDTNVLPGTAPEFNGNITVPEGDTLYWSDGTNMYKADELPLVTRNVTYTAVIKTIKTLAVGTVFTAGDTVDFGEYYFERDDYKGNPTIDNDYGVKIITIIDDWNSNCGQYVFYDENGDIFLVSCSEALNGDVSIKVVAGSGTEDDPFVFKPIVVGAQEHGYKVCPGTPAAQTRTARFSLRESLNKSRPTG